MILSLHAACSLAIESRLPLPTVTKLLKSLQQGGLLISQRGIKGGYSLARPPREISVAEIIVVFEGPIALTECSTDTSGLCDLETCCPIKDNQRIISQVVRGALEKVMLSDLVHPFTWPISGMRAASWCRRSDLYPGECNEHEH